MLRRVGVGNEDVQFGPLRGAGARRRGDVHAGVADRPCDLRQRARLVVHFDHQVHRHPSILTAVGSPLPQTAAAGPIWDDRIVAEPRMVSLGFGKFARSDRIFALEPLRGDERGDGRRTRVWVEGIPDPIVASRTERIILQEMGEEAAAVTPLVDDALDLAQRLVNAAEAGRVDLGDLGRRARRLLASTTEPPDRLPL